MSFIKLSSRLINPAYISSILLRENKYVIKMLHVDIQGSSLFGSGSIESTNEIIICKKEDPQDYGVMNNWINQETKK